MMMTDPFEKFRRSESSEDELHEAAKVLGTVVEPPSFWSAISNDPSMPVAHRKLALVQLIRRHVVPGTTSVGAFAEMLDGALWLNSGNVTIATELGGKVPLKWLQSDTVTAIALPGDHGAMYLAIAGRFGLSEIEIALHGMSRDERIRSAVIRDVGLQVGLESENTTM